MRTPATYDFDINRGSTEPVTIRLRNQETGILLDLTGATIALDIVRGAGRLISKTSADGGLAWDQPTGNITWTPTVAESLSIPNGRLANYVYTVSFAGGPVDEPYLVGFMIGHGYGGG